MMLDTKGISVTLNGQPIVHGASVSIAKGEFVGLIGPNGAGKSTLLRAIAGTGPISDGSVSLMGKDAAQLSRKDRAQHLAYLPQQRRIEWSMRVFDIVALGLFQKGHLPASEKQTIVDAALGKVEAAHLAERSANTLSGGELARVLLARTLATGAPLLLADEPMAGLDPSHQLHVMDILRARAVGGAVMMVLHDLTLASRFLDRVIVMHRGEIVDQGPPAETLTKDRLRAVYGIEPLSGEHEGEPWLIPWRRTSKG